MTLKVRLAMTVKFKVKNKDDIQVQGHHKNNKNQGHHRDDNEVHGHHICLTIIMNLLVIAIKICS